MSCNFIKNEKGKIVGVEQGNELFKQIIANPILSFDESVEAFKNIYTDKIDKEQPLYYRNPQGQIFDSYSEALKATAQGSIEGVVGDTALFSVDANSNINAYHGQINDFIREDLLTGEKYLDVDGQEKFIVSGNSMVKKAVNGEIIKREARRSFGTKNVKQLDNGDFIFKNEKSKLRVKNNKGEDSTISREELMSMDFQQMKSYQDPIALLAKQAYVKNYPAFGTTAPIEEIEFTPENELQVALMNLLNKMGVKTTSISEYVSKYETKNGVAPSAQALADIANKVIAFKDGKITPEELTEEVSHFIVEAWSQEEITDLLRNIHRTAEWKQYAEQYREIYSKEYQGEELEQAVRREILGKVLANSLQSRFAQEVQTETERNIIQRVFDLFNNFMNRIEAFFRAEYQTQLEDFNKSIFNNLMQGELIDSLNTENFEDNRFRLYSTASPLESNAERIRRISEKSINLLEALGYRLNRRDVPAASKVESVRKSIDKIGGSLDDFSQIEMVNAVSGIVSIAQNQLKYLKRAAEKNKDKTYHFSAEEQSVYASLTFEFGRMLHEMQDLLKPQTEQEIQLKKELNTTILEIGALQGSVGNSQTNALEKIVKDYARKASLTTTQEEELRKALNGVQTDTNFIFAHLGQLVNAQSAYLGLAAEISSRLYAQQRIDFQAPTKELLKELERLGFDPTQAKKFAKDGYMENIFNDKLREEAIANKKFELYLREINKVEELKAFHNITREQYDELIAKRELPSLPTNIQSIITNEYRKWEQEEFLESMFIAEENERREKRYEGLSEATINFEKDSQREYGNILSQADKVDGRIVFTKSLKNDIEELKKTRTERKNIFKSDGELKDGLSYTEEEVGKDVVEIGKLRVKIDRNAVADDALVSFELNQVDKANIERMQSEEKAPSGISQAFKDYVAQLPQSEAIEFLYLNSYIGFSQEYYDSFDSKPSLIENLQAKFEETSDEGILEVIEEINTISFKIGNIIKANRTLNQPSEVNFELMSRHGGGEVKQVKELTNQLQAVYKQANGFLGTKEVAEILESPSETTPNKAWIDYLQDSGVERGNLGEYIKLLDNHVSTNDSVKVDNAKDFLRDYLSGKRVTIPDTMKYAFKSEYEGMSLEEKTSVMEEELKLYAESKLLPYFKRTTPRGFTDAIAEMELGNISVLEFLDNYESGQYPYLTVTPNYSFQEANDESKLNKFFQGNLKNSTPQFRVKNEDGAFNKYVNKEYIDKYGIQFEEDGTEIATKNLKDYEARKAFLNYHKKSLEALNVVGMHNIYKLPQKEKGSMLKFAELTKKGGVKNLIEEFVNYREDDVDFGEGANNLIAKSQALRADVIPKYGLRDLSKTENVTDELLTSYTWMAQQAYLYKARVENLGDMLATREALLNSDFGSKSAEATNVFKMMQANLEYNFYGVKESIDAAGEFEIAGIKGSVGAMAKFFTSWVRLVNLGFNTIVPITSALTGGVQLTIERLVGERVDSDAYKKANIEFGRLASAGAAEMGKIKAEARVNVLGEAFGVYGDTERFENSNLGKFGRALGKSAFALHSMANYAVNPRVMLSVLYDSKIVDGQMLNYRQFKDRNRTLTEKQARQEWKNYSSIYDVLETKDGVLSYNKQKLAELRGTNEGEDQFIKDSQQVLTNRINIAVSEIDGGISPEMKSISARNSYMQMIFLHRNWLSISVQKRIKSRHLNMYTGTEEEGVYRSLPRIVNQIVSDWNKNGKTFVQSVKDNWALEKDKPEVRKNIKRMLIELAVVNGLIGIAALAAKGIDDDDEDSYLEVAAEYLLLRTANEATSSTTLTGLSGELYSTLTNVFVGLDKANIILDASEVLDSEVISRGKFAGYQKNEAFLYRYMPIAKEYFSLKELERTRDVYNYFNNVKDEKLKYSVYNFIKE